MNNVIQSLLSTSQSEPNPAIALGFAQKAFQSGIDTAVATAGKVEKQQRDMAINDILSMDPSEDPATYQAALTDRLSNVSGIDPIMALNLGTAKAKPAFQERARQDAKNQLDIENAYKDTTLGETIRHNMASEGFEGKGFGAITTDDGLTWTYDKDTGQFKESKGTAGSKFVDTRDVTSVDPVTGAKTVKTYTIDKRTPGIDAGTGMPIPDSVQYQQLAQVDKDKADSIQATMGLLSEARNGPLDRGTVGNADKFAAWLDNASGFNWGGDTASTIVNDGRWNILGGQLVKTMYGGNASDADRESVFKYVPQSSDGEKVYEAKAHEFAKLLSNNHNLFTKRVNRSNPGYLPSIGKTVVAPDGNTYKIVK